MIISNPFNSNLNFIYFCFNFNRNFILECWNDEPTLAVHLNVKRFSTLKEAKKNATKEETIFFKGEIVTYGNKRENIVQ